MTNDLTLMGGAQTAAMSAFSAVSDEGSAALFPRVAVKDGVFKPTGKQAPEIVDKLPDGSRAVPLIYLTYRIGAMAWQVGYDDRTDDNKRPAFVSIAPASDGTGAKLIAEASKAYHYTKKDNKKNWDFATSQVGHIQPFIEVLAYSPVVDGLIVVHTPTNFNSVDATLDVLNRLVDPVSRQIQQGPIMAAPAREHKVTKAYQWDVDYIAMSPATGPTAADAVVKFKAWLERAQEDLATKAAVEAWQSCSDRPMTAMSLEALNKAVGMAPKRGQ
jgi:hypothetical protein